MSAFDVCDPLEQMIPLKAESLLTKTLSANNLTPIEVFQKIEWGEQTFLLHGSEGGWFDEHYSLFGGQPFGTFQSKQQINHFDCFISGETQSFSSTGDPLIALQGWLDRFQFKTDRSEFPHELPFAFGGVVGFFSYELAQQFEKLPETQEKPDLPDIYLLFLNLYVIFDHRQNKIHIIYNPAPEITLGKSVEAVHQEGLEKIASIEKQITAPIPPTRNETQTLSSPMIQTATACSQETYVNMVCAAKEYIKAGDIFQANLSHRFNAPYASESIFNLYKRLWEINPSPFASYFNFGKIQIASASPERLVRIINESDGQAVETRPIAGTKPRGSNTVQDHAFVTDLFQSEKERAEHLMLVDLERNDLGKVCKYGTVSVHALMVLEKYSHVSHLVSIIKGELRENISALQVLKALFPGGTITGVPKIRCMEIISELEQKPRGIYTGSIGYIGFDGEMDLNIAIRTWVRNKDVLSFQVGAGIVADSNPEQEYQETLQKAAALIEALNLPTNIG